MTKPHVFKATFPCTQNSKNDQSFLSQWYIPPSLVSENSKWVFIKSLVTEPVWKRASSSTQAQQLTLSTTEKGCCKVTDANRCTCNSSDKEAKICTVSLRAAGLSAPPTEWSITCETRNTESFSTLGKASKRSHLSFVKALRGYFHFFSLMRKLLSGVQCSRRLVELVVVTACYIWYDLKITVK